jgi:hypothetical protein
MVKRFLFLILIVIYFPHSFAQNISAKAFTDSLNYQVGDYINLIIQVEHNKNVSISNPVLSDSASKIEIIKQESPEVQTAGLI